MSLVDINRIAHGRLEDEEKCLEAGMNDYVLKPLKRETALEMLDKRVFKSSK
ncbi:MAG: hypothetical protein JRI86_02600 [Deltaproteobacteria bacterium]|nr:hypothetical protein [Deltaproteobacteria bacterium]